MKIIPAIDLIDGKCVRLSQGDYGSKKIYSSNPVEMAQKFEDHGVNYLHIVDLDGAKEKKLINLKTVEAIAKNTRLSVDFGGGIRTEDDLEAAFSAGARKVTLGSVAVQHPEKALQFLEKYGPEKLILGADFENLTIKTSGWLQDSNMDLFAFIQRYFDNGFKEIICTDISKDGMLKGASTEIYTQILQKNKVQLIASGGISSLEDVVKMKEIGCSGTIIGKAIYEDKISLDDLQKLIETFENSAGNA